MLYVSESGTWTRVTGKLTPRSATHEHYCLELRAIPQRRMEPRALEYDSLK